MCCCLQALDEKFINALQETVINVTRFFLQDATGAAAQGMDAATQPGQVGDNHKPVHIC